MKNTTTNLASRLAYAALEAAGAAPGQRSRAATQQSKRDKARNPRLQRKHRNWEKE